jgi:hypothetical protein
MENVRRTDQRELLHFIASDRVTRSSRALGSTLGIAMAFLDFLTAPSRMRERTVEGDRIVRQSTIAGRVRSATWSAIVRSTSSPPR